MTTHSTSLIFVCSFCSKAIRFSASQVGFRVHCPACKRIVQVYPNQNESIDNHLTTYWSYRQFQLFFGDKVVGPISDTEFLSAVRCGVLNTDTEVFSPQATGSEWVALGRVNLALVQEKVDQRVAERQRRERLIEQQRLVDTQNRDKLRRAIRDFVEDGVLTANEQHAVRKFATAAGIPDAEVRHFLAEESGKFAREVIDDAISDGMLDPLEDQRITQILSSLGVPLKLGTEDVRRMDLCRLAHQLNCGTFVPATVHNVPIKLTPNETVVAIIHATWHEIVTTKRDSIPLGEGKYLKEIGTGTVYLTDKQVVLLSALDSKKATLSSVQRVGRYSDGVLFNRSSGKSVFLAIDSRSVEGGRFALLAEYICGRQPVLGIDPINRFVPDVLDAEIGDFSFVEQIDQASYSRNGRWAEPRYTFRVVGDHIGNRSKFISRLRPGLPLWMVREPRNPADRNAVAIFDQGRNQLGYLKREVAEWFGPMLDQGRQFSATVHTLNSSGSLIVAVHE